MKQRTSRLVPRVAALAALAGLIVSSPAVAGHRLAVWGGDNVNLSLFGYSVAAVGDFNGDGATDWVVGSPLGIVADSTRGMAHVYFGGSVVDTIPDLVLTGRSNGDVFGISVAGAGDVNGDGFDDIVVGAPGAAGGGSFRGQAYLYWGGASPDSAPDLTLTGLADSDNLGTSVAGAGDVNGDGFADVIVGADDADSGGANRGAVLLYFGGATPNNGADRVFAGVADFDRFGTAVASAGDVNADGFGDILVGAPGADPGGLSSAGTAYVFLGGLPLPDLVPDATITGTGAGDDLGAFVGPAGDVNGDGIDDWMVGAPDAVSRGRAYLYYGGTTLDGNVDRVFTAPDPSSEFGRVAAVGDLNGDGYGDLAIGASSANGTATGGGRVYVYHGGNPANTTPDLFLDSASDSTGAFGWALASIGDHDGDGIAEILVGEPVADRDGNALPEGAAYVFSTVLGTLPAVSSPVGVASTVTAQLSEDQSFAGATLHHRVGGSAPFTATPMALQSPNVWAGTIPSGSVSPRGVQYYVDADAGGFLTRIPPVGFGNLVVNLTDFNVGDLPASEYRLLGIPIAAANQGQPESVFDELGAYDRAVWRYAVFDGNEYRELDTSPRAPNAAPGQAFWVIARDGGTVTTNGTSTDLSRDHVDLSLRSGWSQIACPYNFAVALPAVLPPGIVANLHAWDGTKYVPFQTTLLPSVGYWIQNTSGSIQPLRLPAVAVSAPRVASLRPWELPEGEEGWNVEVRAVAGSRENDLHWFGMRDAATDGADDLDYSDAPPPPGDFVDVSFLTTEGRRLMVDYRSRAGSGAAWVLELRSDLAGERFRIDFDGDRELPEGWGLIAVDETGTLAWDLVAQPSLTGSLGTPARDQRWHLFAGTPEYLGKAQEDAAFANATRRSQVSLVVGPNPVPVGATASLVLALPTAGPVELRIYDVAGRLVRTLAEGRLETGTYRLTWSGQDDAGQRTSPGVYFARVRSDAGEAVEKIVLIR